MKVGRREHVHCYIHIWINYSYVTKCIWCFPHMERGDKRWDGSAEFPSISRSSYRYLFFKTHTYMCLFILQEIMGGKLKEESGDEKMVQDLFKVCRTSCFARLLVASSILAWWWWWSVFCNYWFCLCDLLFSFDQLLFPRGCRQKRDMFTWLYY